MVKTKIKNPEHYAHFGAVTSYCNFTHCFSITNFGNRLVTLLSRSDIYPKRNFIPFVPMIPKTI